MDSTRFPEKKTVLLINPHHHRSWRYGESVFSFPIGIMYLGTALKHAGYVPVIVDACIDERFQDSIRTRLPETLYVGISAMTPQVPHACEIATFIRTISPETPIVWGGIHPSLYPSTCLDSRCDVAVIGEGDRTCVELAEAYSRGLTPDRMTDIDGLAWADRGAVVMSPPRRLIDMDSLPDVDYSMIDAERYIESYVIQEKRKARVIPVHAARGCPWHCTFCINTTLNAERRYRARSPEHLMAEMESLISRFRLDGIMFQDEEFFANRGRVLGILDIIESRKLNHIRYYATSRVNHFRPGYIDRAFLQRLKACGFVDLVFGFESGSRHCLEIIQKEISVEQGLYAARLLAAEEFHTVWGFIMALPGESRQDLIRTLRIMEQLRKINPRSYFIGPQVFRPYPGSELYRQALAAGMTEPATLDEWSRQPFTAEGRIDHMSLPWVRETDVELIRMINFIAPVYYNHHYLTESPVSALFHLLLRILFKLRLDLNCWHLPFEHRLRASVAGILRRISSTFRGPDEKGTEP